RNNNSSVSCAGNPPVRHSLRERTKGCYEYAKQQHNTFLHLMIQAALILKNEKDHVDDVLSSLEGLDIVVLDTGSTDNTVELARKYTKNVYTDYEWNDHFAEARNAV